MKRLLLITLSFIAVATQAQEATNSPYSQYGYGTLADQANGASVAMGGVAQGWREGNTVNFGNAASYSALDSLTFIFDAGISGQVTNFSENSRRLNANNTSVDYIIGAFRLMKHAGLAFGVMPYSNIGYSYSNESTIGASTNTGDSKTTCTNTYSGEGGIHQAFVGLGIEPLKTRWTSFSVGANISYVWGDYTKSIVNSYSDAYVNTLSKYYKAEINSWKVDLSAQFQQRLSKRDKITLGATYTLGHEMKSDPYCMIISNNSQTGVADTTTIEAQGKLAIPRALTVGLVFNHANRWRVGVDWKHEAWSGVDYPMYQVVNDQPTYTMQSGQFTDRDKFMFGFEYCHKELSRRWVDRVRYRLGASYATPYLVINGAEGPKEYGISGGLGIPITNGYNNRSILNISAQWVHQEAVGMIKENTFRINVGFTFNERWFAKWQVE